MGMGRLCYEGTSALVSCRISALAVSQVKFFELMTRFKLQISARPGKARTLLAPSLGLHER
jgi:hypothetical protein